MARRRGSGADPSRLPFHNVESTEKGRIRLVRHGWCADLLDYLLKGADNMPLSPRTDDRFRKNLHDCDQLVERSARPRGS